MRVFRKNEVNTCLCLELPSLAYEHALNLQRALVVLRRDRYIRSDIFILLEHPPVFTLGRRGMRNNFKVSEAHLKSANIPIVPVERGGDITYHGPGQLVGYPILNLYQANLGVVDYVKYLEEVMLRTAADWGIPAERNARNRGVWAGNQKLGSVGIAVQRGISFHGFALNVNTNLGPFNWINPCGLKNIGMTSMAHQLSRNISVNKVRLAVKRHMETVFKFKLVETELNTLMPGIQSVENLIVRPPVQVSVPLGST